MGPAMPARYPHADKRRQEYAVINFKSASRMRHECSRIVRIGDKQNIWSKFTRDRKTVVITIRDFSRMTRCVSCACARQSESVVLINLSQSMFFHADKINTIMMLSFIAPQPTHSPTIYFFFPPQSSISPRWKEGIRKPCRLNCTDRRFRLIDAYNVISSIKSCR